MLEQPARTDPDTETVEATIAECEEILSTIGSLATAEAYQQLYDDLVRLSECRMPPAQRDELAGIIDKVRWAWWLAKCRANNGPAIFRALTVHSSQLHTGL